MSDVVPTIEEKSAGIEEARQYKVSTLFMTDVTKNFTDLNEEDTIFRIKDGTLVKVKTWRDAVGGEAGNEIFRVCGSIVGKDGKVLIREDGNNTVYFHKRTATIHSHSITDTSIWINRLREDAVLDTLQAHDHYTQITKMSGIKTIKFNQGGKND